MRSGIEKTGVRIAERFSRTEFTDKTEWDPLRGAVHIALWGSAIIAAITVWNKGDICAEALKQGKEKEIVQIEDRVLNQNEDIAALLDSVLERFFAADASR